MLSNLFTEGKKILIIPNALDFSTEYERLAMTIEGEFQDLKRIGLEPEKLDLRDYFHKNDQSLGDRLTKAQGVWVIGGNTFVLRRAMYYSGFDNIVNTLPDSYIYSGYSAGASVLPSSLKGLETVDFSEIVPQDYENEIIWNGLGLIDFYIAPHYQSEHPESEAVNELVAYYIRNNLSFNTLKDGEEIVLDK